MPRTFAARLASLVLAALVVRLVYALVVMGDGPVTGDGRQFHFLAIVLAEEQRFLQPFRFLFQNGTVVPTAEKPLLYPLALAVPSALGLKTYAAHKALSCLLGAAAVGVIGLLGRRVGGDRTGLVAAALAAVYPSLIVLDGSLRSESLYVLMIALVLLAAYRVVERPSAGRAVALGALIGLAALTRSEALALLALLVAPLLFLMPRARRLRAAAAVLAGCLLFVGPWLARNWITFDRPAALSTNEGGLLAGANCDAAYFSPLIGTWPCFPDHRPEWGENEAVISGILRRQALDYMGDHASRLPAVVAIRMLRTWELYRPRSQAVLESQIADRQLRFHQAGVAMLYVLALLSAAGLVVLRGRGAPVRMLISVAVLVTLVSAATYGSSRFRAAAEVPLVVLAAVAAVALADRRRARAVPVSAPGAPRRAEVGAGAA